MMAKKHLLLLAVLTVLVKCQLRPKVSMSPTLTQVFTGDLFYLRCDYGETGNTLKWYLNNVEQKWTNKTLKIAVAAPKDSGSYQCEINGQKSDNLTIHVQEFIPSASLTIETGQPVMRTESSVSLKLENEDGLQGWKCLVYKGEKQRVIQPKRQKDSMSPWVFQSYRLLDPETIYWCTDRTKEYRSNQVIVKTSDKPVSLEIYSLPPVAGESVTLRCHVWGTDQVSHTVFYKDDTVIKEGPSTEYKIANMTNSALGRYKCIATFTRSARTSGPPFQETSDIQDVLSQVHPITAHLSGDMSCSCPLCPSGMSYQYYKEAGQSWERLNIDQKPKESGTYRCRAVWNKMRTPLSRSVSLSASQGSTIILLLIFLVGLGILISSVALYIRYKRRNATGPIYEDVPLRSHYETVQKAHGREDDYETLNPQAPVRESKGGEYEALKKEDMKGGEYHTLGMEGAAKGEGGYEALKKEGVKEDVYHTLGIEGAAGGDGGV